jgi:hypothetical protein
MSFLTVFMCAAENNSSVTTKGTRHFFLVCTMYHWTREAWQGQSRVDLFMSIPRATGCSATQETTVQRQWPANSGSQMGDIKETATSEGGLPIGSVSLSRTITRREGSWNRQSCCSCNAQEFRLVIGRTGFE